MSWKGRMTGEILLSLLQQMTREERAAPIIVHLEDDEGDEHMGDPTGIHHEYDCDDKGVLRFNCSTTESDSPFNPDGN